MFYLDFLAGFALMNAMPHLLFGLFEIRFLSAFGFGPKANLAYAFLNVVIAAAIFAYANGTEALVQNGLFWGVVAMFVVYLMSGRFFFALFHKNRPF